MPIGLRTNGLTARNGCHAAPLIHGRHFVPASIHIGSTRIGSGFSPFDFDLFVLNHDIVVSHGFATRHFIGEAQEAESTTLFLLLVVHDHHFYDIAVAHEETLNLRLRDIRGQTAQKHLGVILSHIGLLWFLHAPRIASLGIDGSTIERMRYTGQNRVDICGIRERHETKTTGTSRFRIFHHDAINDLAEATKIRQECLLGGIPTKSAHKKFALFIVVVSVFFTLDPLRGRATHHMGTLGHVEGRNADSGRSYPSEISAGKGDVPYTTMK